MYTQVYSDPKDADILVQLSDTQTVAANFLSMWHGARNMVLMARPHLLGLVRQLENDGKKPDADKIRKLYEKLFGTTEKLTVEASLIMRKAAEEKVPRACAQNRASI